MLRSGQARIALTQLSIDNLDLGFHFEFASFVEQEILPGLPQPERTDADLLGDGMKLAAVGGLVGLVLALLVARLLSQMLFGISTFDPLTFALVPSLLGGIALLGTYIPARRASRVDPVSALRAE